MAAERGDRVDNDQRAVVKPSYQNKAGHPVVIPSTMAAIVPDTDIVGGLAKLIADSGLPVAAVAVDDPAVLKNINTMDDLNHG